MRERGLKPLAVDCPRSSLTIAARAEVDSRVASATAGHRGSRMIDCDAFQNRS